MVLSETWTDKKGWKRIKGRLPRGYEWGVQCAKRENRKGRAMREMLMGIKKELIEKETKIEVEREGMVIGRVRRGVEKWRIVGVYVNKDIGGNRRKKKRIQEHEEK